MTFMQTICGPSIGTTRSSYRRSRKVEWREGSGRGIRPRRLKVIGRDAHHRLLTLIIEAPDNRGAARLVTVFPTDNDDEINRYWQSR